jgi:hypothetical protein
MTLLLLAALTALTPQGDRLTLMREWRPRLDVLSMLGEGAAQAYRIALRTQSSEAWFTFAADWDSTVRWPARQTIALDLKDGRIFEASVIMAMSPRPEWRPIFLGQFSREVDPGDLEHGRTGDVVLLVSFPKPDLALRDINGVRVVQRSRATALAPASGGAP